MKVPVKWLKEYVDFDINTEELAHLLTMAGLEVEDIIDYQPQFDNVFVGQIEEKEQHPNADKLSLCKVRVSVEGEALNIVCGAKNISAGDKVPVAVNGANLSAIGLKIKKSKIRDVESNGMICSESELGFADKSEGVIILPEDAPIGVKFEDYLDISDSVLEINVTPNRPDALSLIGVAREVAALLKKKIKFPELSLSEEDKTTESLVSVNLEDNKDCMRYSARVIEDVKIADSPLELKIKLDKIGIRSVNNVVDITNLVLMEYGQPLHAFDYKLSGGKINVRRAKSGEVLKAIDDKDYKLDSEVLVIADEQKPLAVAGIMGGKDSEVSDATTDILLESAVFTPSLVRRGTKKLTLFSDSSYRFERGVDYEQVINASNRASSLIAKYAGGKVLKGMVDVKGEKPVNMMITFRPERCDQILGTEIDLATIKDIFVSLGCEVYAENKGVLDVIPPSCRHDLEREIDLIEEVARMYGYDNLEMRVGKTNPSPQKTSPVHPLSKQIRNILSGAGLREFINYSFVNKNFTDKLQITEKDFDVNSIIKIANPVTEDTSVMRTSMVPGMLNVVSFNHNQSNFSVSGFELGRVYKWEDSKPVEHEMLSLVVNGNKVESKWNAEAVKYDFYDLKGIVEVLFESLGIKEIEFLPYCASYMHPNRIAAVKICGKEIGFFGEVDSDILENYDIDGSVFLAEFDLEVIAEVAGIAKTKYSSLPKYPGISRDIAFLADEELTHNEVEAAILGLKIPLLDSFNLFDVYTGEQVEEGKKSMAYSFLYRSAKKTLKDKEVAHFHDKIIKTLQKDLNCVIR